MVPFAKRGYGFVVAFRSNHGRIFSRFDAIHERERQTPSQTPHDGFCTASRGKNYIEEFVGRPHELRGCRQSVAAELRTKQACESIAQSRRDEIRRLDSLLDACLSTIGSISNAPLFLLRSSRHKTGRD